jgi:hypothetical protein
MNQFSKRRFRPRLEVLETRITPDTYQWYGGATGGTDVWARSSNWLHYDFSSQVWSPGISYPNSTADVIYLTNISTLGGNNRDLNIGANRNCARLYEDNSVTQDLLFPSGTTLKVAGTSSTSTLGGWGGGWTMWGVDNTSNYTFEIGTGQFQLSSNANFNATSSLTGTAQAGTVKVDIDATITLDSNGMSTYSDSNWAFSGAYTNTTSSPTWKFYKGAGISIATGDFQTYKDTFTSSNGSPGNITINSGTFAVYNNGNTTSDLGLWNKGGAVTLYNGAVYNANALFGTNSNLAYQQDSGTCNMYDSSNFNCLAGGTYGHMSIQSGYFQLTNSAVAGDVSAKVTGYLDLTGNNTNLDLQVGDGTTYHKGTLNVTKDFSMSGGKMEIDCNYTTGSSDLLNVTGNVTLTANSGSNPQIIPGTYGAQDNSKQFTFITWGGTENGNFGIAAPWIIGTVAGGKGFYIQH